MQNKDVILFRKRDDFLIQRPVADAAHRVRRQRNDHVFCLLRHVFGNGRDIRQKVRLFCHRIIPRLCTGHFRPRNKYRVARRRQKHCVSFVAEHHANVAHALLRAIAAADHVGRNGDAIALFVVADHGIQKLRGIVEGVLPVRRIHRRLRERLSDVLRRLKIRRPHAHVVEGLPLLLQLQPPAVQRGKDLRSKPVQTF